MENVQKPAKKLDINKGIFIVLSIIGPLAAFAVFYIYINASSILLAFQRPTYNGSGEVEWGIMNFTMFFNDIQKSDSDVLGNLKNTLIYFSCDTFIRMPLSLIICYFVYKKILFGKAFRAIIFLPNIITGTIFAALFQYLVGYGGPLYALWEVLGQEPIAFFKDSDYALGALIFFSVYSGLGGNFVIFGGAMNSIEDSTLEAAKIDGAGPFRELISIIVPGIWPTLGTILLMTSVGVFGASGPLLLFTQGKYGTNSLSFWIFSMTTGIGGSEDYYYASAIGLILTIVALPIVLTVRKVTNLMKED